MSRDIDVVLSISRVTMRHVPPLAPFHAGIVLSAWLRFDAGYFLISWILVVFGLAGTIAVALIRARHLPAIELPRIVNELGDREELTAEEEAQYAEALRAWHRDNQRTGWREAVRRGPGRLVIARAAFFFLWASVLAVALVPPTIVPGVFDPVPRFIVVLLPLAAGSVAIATPFGIRDWRRARRELARDNVFNERG